MPDWTCSDAAARVRPSNRPELDRFKPASMQPGSDLLAPFWIVFFLIFGGLFWFLGRGL